MVGGLIQRRRQHGRSLGDDAAQLRHVRAHLDAEFPQELLTHCAACHARHGFSRTRALEDVARVLAIVFQRSGKIGVAGPRPRHLPATPQGIGGGIGLRCHDVLPVLPVAIPDQHGDRGAEGFAGADAGEPLDAVGFDLHARAAAVPALAALQLGVHVGG